MATTIERARNETDNTAPLLDLKKKIAQRIPQLSSDAKDDLLELINTMLFCRDPKQITEMLTVMFEMLWPETLLGGMQDGTPPPKNSEEDLKGWKSWVGAKVRQLREEREWTQEELAKKTGLPQSHISRIEKAKHSPSHLTIEKLAKAFKISLSKLDPSL